MTMTAPLAALLDVFAPYDAEEKAICDQLRQFINHSPNPYGRDNLTAHVVADAWIVNPARDAVILVEHLLNKFWMAPGGHCDGSPDVFGAALREAEEEAGLTAAHLRPLLNGGIFDINSGFVTLRHKEWGIEPTHVHFDVCFAFEADDNVPLTVSHESTGLKWMPLDGIENSGFFPSHLRRVHKMRAGILAAPADAQKVSA